MAIPSDVTSIVVTGKYVDASGAPATGTVTFTPTLWTASSGDNAVLPPSSIVATLGTAGTFAGTLVVTNDTDLQPQPWQYSVTERVNGVVREFTINLPSTLGGTVDMADLVPALPAGTAYYSLVSSLSIGTVTTIPTGGTATADITGDAPNQLLNLGLVTGPAGPQGPAGPATIAVGTVSSVAYGGTASVVNSGTSENAILDFVLRDGPTGPQGTAASITVGTVSSVTNAGTASVTNSGTSENAILDFVLRDGPTGPQGPPGPQGDPGPKGDAATIAVGTVGFVAYPGPGTVTNSGTSGSAVLDFVLVQGPQGDIAGLTATQPIDYTAGNFSLFYGAGLGTATGGTLVANLSDANAQALGVAAAGTLTTISRADHVHAMPSAVDVGAVGTADLSNANAQPLGVAAAGTLTSVSRADHVHVMPSAADVGAVGTATSITAGTALAGGGDLSVSRTLNVVLSDSAAASLGAAAAAGTAVLPARSDHVHPTPSDLVSLAVAVSDETTALTTGTAKVTFRMPHAMTLTAVRASVTTAPTGATIVVDVNEGGASILGTKLSIDASEKTSTTAASAATITDTALADDAEITIDIDQVGSTVAGAGLKVYLIGTRA